MFIPTGDTPNPRNFTPWVTWGLIAANVAVYVLVSLPLSTRQASPDDPDLIEYVTVFAPRAADQFARAYLARQVNAYELFVFAHGYKPGAPELSDLLFSLFLHAGLLHLAGNMLFLYIFGDNAEHRLGRGLFLAVYLLTGVVATLFFSMWAGRSLVPLVGASGAISGVLGLYFLLFPRNRVKVFVFLFPFLFNTFLIPARWVLGFYLLIENLLPFMIASESNVAYGAHIGGFLAGLVVAWVGERVHWRLPWRDSFKRAASSRASRTVDVEVEPVAREYGPLEALRAHLVRGNADGAVAALGRMDARDLAQLQPRECVRLAGWLEDGGFPASAGRLLKMCLVRHPTHGALAEVYLQLGLMRLRQGQQAAAYQHLLSVFDHDPLPEVAARAHEALSRIDMFRRRR